MTNTTATICPVCKSDDVGILQRTIAEESRGTPVSFVDELSKCNACGEQFYTMEQSVASSRAYAAAVREAHGLLSPEQIRDARIRLGMTQEEFESALAVGKKTVVRWERGTVAPSRAANGLLWFAAYFPDVFKEYARSRMGQAEPGEMEKKVIAIIAPVEDAEPVVVKLKGPKVSYAFSPRTGEQPVLLGQL